MTLLTPPAQSPMLKEGNLCSPEWVRWFVNTWMPQLQAAMDASNLDMTLPTPPTQSRLIKEGDLCSPEWVRWFTVELLPRIQTAIDGGGGGGVTTFSDDFNRSDVVASGLGPTWISHLGRPVSPGFYALARILSNQFRAFTPAGAGNRSPGSYWLPIATISAVYGIAQYAQAKLIAVTTSVSPASGPAVMITPDITGNNGNGYNLEVLSATSAVLVQFAAGAFNVIGGPYTVAVNDVLRIEVDPTAGSNVVRFYRNTTLTDTVTDSSGARPILTGSPGMFVYMDDGDTTDWDDFSGGAL